MIDFGLPARYNRGGGDSKFAGVHAGYCVGYGRAGHGRGSGDSVGAGDGPNGTSTGAGHAEGYGRYTGEGEGEGTGLCCGTSYGKMTYD